MYNRLNNQIVIANKLLDDIKSEYQGLFERLKSLSTKAHHDGAFCLGTLAMMKLAF